MVTATQLLALSDLGLGEDTARERVTACLGDGSALMAYERWIRAQGGDPDPVLLPRADVVVEVPAQADGYVRRVRPRGVAAAATALGAGRERKDESVDHAVGVVCLAKHGDRVANGQPLAEIHARSDAAAAAAAGTLVDAYEIGDEPEPRPLVLDVIR